MQLRKFVVPVICLVILLTLAGCKSDVPQNDSVQGEPTPSAAPIETNTPAPTAVVYTPEPDPLLAPDSFEYSSISNETLGIEFDAPSHWTLVPGRKTLCYEEPSAPGEPAARIAITATTVKKKPNSIMMKDQLSRFLTLLEDDYDSFEAGDQSGKVKMMESAGLRQLYTAQENGVEITGYVLLTYAADNKRIYLMHFNAPTDRYDELSDVRDVIRKSIKLAK